MSERVDAPGPSPQAQLGPAISLVVYILGDPRAKQAAPWPPSAAVLFLVRTNDRQSLPPRWCPGSGSRLLMQALDASARGTGRTGPTLFEDTQLAPSKSSGQRLDVRARPLDEARARTVPMPGTLSIASEIRPFCPGRRLVTGCWYSRVLAYQPAGVSRRAVDDDGACLPRFGLSPFSLTYANAAVYGPSRLRG